MAEQEKTSGERNLTPGDIAGVAMTALDLSLFAHDGQPMESHGCNSCMELTAALGNWASAHMMAPEELAVWEARRCRVCGCGNATPCVLDEDEGTTCGWAESDRCTRCASPAPRLVVPGRDLVVP